MADLRSELDVKRACGDSLNPFCHGWLDVGAPPPSMISAFVLCARRGVSPRARCYLHGRHQQGRSAPGRSLPAARDTQSRVKRCLDHCEKLVAATRSVECFMENPIHLTPTLWGQAPHR